MAAAHGHTAGARDLEDGVATLGDDLDEAFDFGGAAGEFEHDGLGREVDDAGFENGGELEDLRARVLAKGVRRAGCNLDEAELADDGIGAADLVYFDGDLEFVERGADAVRRMIGRLADDSHAGDVGAFRFAYCQRDD